MTEAMKTGIAKADRQGVAHELAKTLADSFAVYLKTHGYHWNVRGPQFFSLHSLLEQQYTEIWQALDDLAERMRALGELAPQGPAAFANLTSIGEGKPETEATEMIRELVKDNETLVATARKGVEIAEEAGDAATADLLTERLAAHEKHAWMLRAQLEPR